jgi:hypothetical protein
MAHKLDERKWNITLMCEKSGSSTYKNHFVREMMNAKEVSFRYCSTSDMGVDALTKPILTPKHFKCMKLLGLTPQECLEQVGV